MLVNTYKPDLKLLLMVYLTIASISLQAQVWPLDKCIETALVNNQNLELGRNNIQIGKDRQNQIKANLFPKVKIETDYKYFVDLPYQLMPLSVFGGPEGHYKEAQFGVPHNINANLQFAYPIYNPQLKSNIENSKIGIEIAELQYQKSEEQIYFEISNLYYNAQIILSQINFIEDNIETSNKLLKNIELLHKQLLAKSTDVDKISLQILQLESKSSILKSNYDQILNGMKTLMGISLDQTFDIESKIEYHDIVNYSSESTTDIQMVETKNRLLLGELNTLKKSQLPSVMIYGSYGLTGYGYDQSPNDFLNFYRMGFVGLKATYNLFDGNITKKKKNIKLKELTNNNIQLQLLKDQTNLKVTNAKLKIGISRKTVETTLSQIDFAKSIYDKTIIQQKQDLASLTDVLLADSAVREAQQNYLSAIVEYIKADLELKKLSGNILK